MATSQTGAAGTETPRLISRLGVLQGIVPYKRSWLTRDVIAGATLAAVAIPEGLGYAKIAGMPPETGLYTCLIPVLLFALFCSSKRLVVGADSATAAISAAAVGALAADDPSAFIPLTCALAVMTGLALLLAGRLSLGFLSDFLSRSVLAGFLTGVGIQIAISQLHSLLGVEAKADSTWGKLVATFEHLGETNVADLAIAVAVITGILILGKVAPKFPGPLLALVASIALSWAFDLSGRFGVTMVGALPQGLPTFSLPIADPAMMTGLVPTAGVLLLVQIGQSISTSSAFAVQHDDKYDANKDLYALGAANIGNGLFGSFVVNGSPTKTAVSDQAGARSQMAMVVLAVLTIPVLLFLTGAFAYLPEAALAAIVFVIAIHLMKFSTLRYLRRLPGHHGEYRVAVSTAAFVAIFGVGGGILWAIVASIAHNLTHASRPANSVLTVEDGVRHDNPIEPGVQTDPGLIVYRFAANLFFANSPRLVEDVTTLMESAPDPVTVFVLDASELHTVDWTSAEALRKAIKIVQAHGAKFIIARLPEQTRPVLDYYGITDLIGADAYVDTVRHALKFYDRPTDT